MLFRTYENIHEVQTNTNLRIVTCFYPMKSIVLTLSIALALISCSSGEKKSNSTYTVDNFPKEWIEVEYENGKWIIFEPCDAVTPELKFSNENGKNIFTVLSGQVADPYFVEAFEQKQDGSVIVSTRFENNSEIIKYLFTKTGPENIWSVKSPDNIESHYVEKQYSGNYSKVAQPCRECWDEEQCAEMEKNK